MVVPFYTAGIDYSIPICYILNQQEEMVALSIQLVSITPSRYTKLVALSIQLVSITPSRSVLY